MTLINTRLQVEVIMNNHKENASIIERELEIPACGVACYGVANPAHTSFSPGGEVLTDRAYLVPACTA